MSRKKQLTSLRNAIFDALGDAVDIKEIMNSLGVLSTGDVRTLRNQLKTTNDAISVLKQYDAISKYLNFLKPGEVRYGSTYTPVEYRKKNVTQEALSRFYANQSAEEYLKRSKERRAEQWNRFSENSKKFYEDLEANRPLSSIRDTSIPSGISYGSDLDDITYRTSEQEALRDDYRRRESQTIENKERRHEANRLARERYQDSMREIRDPSHIERRRLYESFLEVDESTGESSLDQRKAAVKKAREVLAAEKANTKGVNANTKALTGLRAYLGPYAKAVMPYYAMNLASQVVRQDAQAGQFALSRKAFERTFVGDEGDVERYGAYADFRKRYFAAGGKHENARKAFFNEISWATGLGLGEGVDRIKKIAIATGGRAPSSEIVNNPEALFKWYAEVIPTLDIKQRTNLSRIAGVGQDVIAAYSGKLGGKLGLQNIIAQEAGERNLGTSLVRHPIDYVSTWLQSNFPNVIRSITEGGLGSFWLQSIGYSYGIESLTGLLENLVRGEVSKTINNNIYVTTNLSGDEEVIRVIPKAIVNEISNAEK